MTKSVKGRVGARIARQSDRIVDLASRLVAIPAENPPGRAYAECVELLQTELEALDLPCEVSEARRT
jgi:acetylornithine deacetylase/succinyl-diaminopimelate desuccinylase-like protein